MTSIQKRSALGPFAFLAALLMLFSGDAASLSAQGGNADADADADEPVDGYASPEEAARHFLEGLRDGDAERVRRGVPPRERETFDRYGQRLIQALELERFTLGETRPQEDNEARAYTLYAWKVRVDEQEMIDAQLDDLRADLLERGMSEAQVESHLEEQAPIVRRFTRSLAQQMRREEQRMVLVQFEGRWYVDDITDPRYEAEQEDNDNDDDE